MSNSTRWLNASAPCRLEWRPSGVLAVGLSAMGVLGAWSVGASAVPVTVAWPLAGAALLGGAWLAWRYAEMPSIAVLVAASEVRVDGVVAEHVGWDWRGPIARLAWVERGRVRRLLWWPDTLPPAMRRELKLALAARDAGAATAAMAP